MTGRRATGASLDDALERHSAGASPGFLLWHATLRWQRAVALALSDEGLTHVQFLVLASCWWLSRTAQVPSQREIALHAGVDQVMTSQVVRALEVDALLERTRDSVDGRVVRVRLTPSGRSLAARSVVVMDELDAEFFGVCEPMGALLDQLRRLGGRTPTGGSVEID